MNALFPTCKQGLLDKLFDLNSDVIKMSLISAAYVYSSTHDEYSGASRDVPLVAIVAESAQLTSPTIVNGVFDTADFSFSAVSGSVVTSLIQWDDTLTNDRLICYWDQGVTGLPLTPNSGTVNGTVNTAGFWTL